VASEPTGKVYNFFDGKDQYSVYPISQICYDDFAMTESILCHFCDKPVDLTVDKCSDEQN
jgi:hypothetical protein